MPSAIGVYYPEDYGAHTTPDSRSESNNGLLGRIKAGVRVSVLSALGYSESRLKLWQKLLQPLFVRKFYLDATYGYGDRFPRFVKDGKAFEIGCGNCVYLSFLKKHGWDVLGVDMSQQAAEKAREAFGIEVLVGQIEEAGLARHSFDYIHLSHVVEHFFDPLKAMKLVADLLKPGGTLYMEVPNAGGIRAELSGEYWYGWDAPRH
ncbi:MAG: class I SAM-dependent methyltransferase, partial [Acidobacteriota bacterium]